MDKSQFNYEMTSEIANRMRVLADCLDDLKDQEFPEMGALMVRAGLARCSELLSKHIIGNHYK